MPTGPELFQPERANSKGFDLTHSPTLDAIETPRAPFADATWQAAPLLAGDASPEAPEPSATPPIRRSRRHGGHASDGRCGHRP